MGVWRFTDVCQPVAANDTDGTPVGDAERTCTRGIVAVLGR